MARYKIAALTEKIIKGLKPGEKAYKVWDGRGLYLLVTPQGSKLWRFDYTFGGKRKTLALGSYPEISLTEAREKALLYRSLLQKGIDPAEEKRKEKLSQRNTLDAVFEEFFEKFSRGWKKSYIRTVRQRYEKYVKPSLGEVEVSKIDAPLLAQKLDILIREGKIGTARKIRILIGQILRYALTKGLTQYDPTPALRGIIPQVKEKHMPAVTDERRFAEILKAFWDYPHSVVVRYALRILVYTFQRPGEVVSMRWEDIDFEKREWRFVLSKVDREHIVPLASQVIQILENLKHFTGHTPFVFASLVSPQTRHITAETLNAALKRMGINTKEEQTAHGFRATARTLLHEVLGYQPDIIEHQLGHRVPDRLGEAYNRTRFMEERRKMMQDWADFIDRILSSKGSY